MMSGLILGNVIKAGEPPPVIKTVRLGGQYSKKETPYAGFSGISGHYEVELESAQMGGRSLSVKSAEFHGWGSPDTTVDKWTGSYALPFQWGTDQNPSHGDPATIDLKAYYVPKNNNINRRRIMRGTLVTRFGSAHWKTAYVVDIDESGYPEVDSVPELLPHYQAFRSVVSDLAYNSRVPLWDDLRLRYSKMLCAVVDVRIAQGGVSS